MFQHKQPTHHLKKGKTVHLHAIITPRNWGIAINTAWYMDTKEVSIQFGPFNAFAVFGDK
jgi:hypothetical protein